MTRPADGGDELQRRFVRAAMEAPYLAREEERELALRWRDQADQAALHRLTGAHARLVIAVAGRFRHYALPMSDLVQEGHVGLLEAAARFEPEREVRFSTYATWWVRASIQDYVLRNWSIVRGGTSAAQKTLFFSLRRLRARLGGGRDERLSLDLRDRIAALVGVAPADVALMEVRLSGSGLSLNASIGDEEGREPIAWLVDDGPLPDESAAEAIDAERRRSWLAQALQCLSERELYILRGRRLDEEPTTLEALGCRLGISKERVRQIEHRALDKLRRSFLERYPDQEVGGDQGR